MLFSRICRDEGDGAGGGVDDSNASSKKGQDDSQAGAGNEGATGANKGGTTDPSKPKGDEKPTVESLTAELKEWKGKHETLSTKLGTQASKLGTKAKSLDDFQDALNKNPEHVIASLAKEAGIEFNVGKKSDSNADLLKALDSEDPAVRAAVADKIQGDRREVALFDGVMEKLSPTVKAMQDQVMAGKYPDFDDLGDVRDSISLKIDTGQLMKTEVLQLAARGANMTEAVKAAGELAVEEYKQVLAKKKEGQLGAGGVAGIDGSGKDGKISIMDILPILRKRPGAQT